MALFSFATVQLATLLIQETKAAIYETAIGVARAVGVPVDTWQPGDPTRSLYHLESEVLESLEGIVVGFIRSGFLDYAAQAALDNPSDPKARGWLNVVAKQVFNVDVPEATAATTDVVLTNTGGGYYPDIAAGDLTFKCSLSKKTYTNTTGGTLASGPGTTLTVTVRADELGSDSSAGATEINELVTGLIGVTCSNPLAAVGTDEQDPATTVQQCRDKLGSLSPNGPKEAYSFVARNPTLSGTTAVTRPRVYGNSDIGEVTTYLAGPSGGVAEPDRVLVEAAIVKWATPLCITPTVLAATNVTVNVTYALWIYKSVNKTEAEIKADIETALEQMFSTRAIGGDIIQPATSGSLYHSLIESTIREVFPQTFRVDVATPAGDTAITNGQVATLGTVTGNVQIVVDP